MKTHVTTMVLGFSLLAGCAAAPRGSQTPDWLSGAPEKYPATQNLIGRGQAPVGEEARDRARADLVKTFEVNVAVESEDVQAFRSAAGGQYEARSARRITARTERVVEGIEIAEVWHDPVTGTYHALAVLPRLKATTTLRQEIERLDGDTRVQLDRARDAQDLLLKIAAASHALVAQSERAAVQKSLRVVDPTGRGDEPQWSLGRLGADLDALLKRMRLAPRVASDSTDGFEQIAQGALAAAGFLADTGEKPDYTLEASLALDDLGQQDGWYWQRGTMEVRLIENDTGRVRGNKRWSAIKVSALARDGAVKRALDQADAILKKELRAAIIGFAAGAAAN